MDFIKSLKQLQGWKNLPNFRAEPRVDFIIAGALPEILKERYGCGIKMLIPELPIRIGSISKEAKDQNNDKSYKTDLYVYLENGKHIFIEFKTESGPRNPEQEKYLLDSADAKMEKILNGIIKIYSVAKPKYRPKYKYLLEKIREESGLISYDGKEYVTNMSNEEIEILYIQPEAKKSDEIGFDTIAGIMEESEDPVYQKFAEVVLEWALNSEDGIV